MIEKSHGLSIGIERSGQTIMLVLKVVGKLTHEDYQLITPMLEGALQGIEQPKINALVDVSQMEGWELQAAWDDFKLGIKHGSEFERIALIGNKQWQQRMAAVANWFISGRVEFFEEKSNALEWLTFKG